MHYQEERDTEPVPTHLSLVVYKDKDPPKKAMICEISRYNARSSQVRKNYRWIDRQIDRYSDRQIDIQIDRYIYDWTCLPSDRREHGQPVRGGRGDWTNKAHNQPINY